MRGKFSYDGRMIRVCPRRRTARARVRTGVHGPHHCVLSRAQVLWAAIPVFLWTVRGLPGRYHVRDCEPGSCHREGSRFWAQSRTTNDANHRRVSGQVVHPQLGAAPSQ